MSALSSWNVVASTRTLAHERSWKYTSCGPAVRQWRCPSGTLKSVMREVLRHPRIFYEKHCRVEKGDTEQALRQLSRLYCPSSYELPESFCCEVPNAHITDQGTVSTETREVLLESQLENWQRARLDFLRSVRHSPAFLSGRWFPLLTFYPKNYAHWLMDVLPLVALLEQVKSEVSLLMPAVVRPFQRESLQLLGLAHLPMRVTDPFVQVENLIFPHSAIYSGVPRREHLIKVQKRLWKGAGVEPRLQKRIFISRSGSERRLVNESELEPLLRERGFEIIHAEKLSLTEQIRLFSQAQIIAGAHGAGIMNQLFAPQGTDIIEFFNPLFWHENNVRIAGILHQRHWHLFGRDVGGRFDTAVDVKQCRKLLDLVLEMKADETALSNQA